VGPERDQARRQQFLAALLLAKEAYTQVLRGARQAGVPVVGSTEGWEVEGSAGAASATAAKVREATIDAFDAHNDRRLRR
jgi:hypothetical protein